MRGPHNRYKVGDRVVSFRGEKATVTRIRESANYRSKSHRVCVKWDEVKHGRRDDPVEYYEEVFKPCSEESSTSMN